MTSGEVARRLERSLDQAQTGQVIAFPGTAPGLHRGAPPALGAVSYRFSMRDRMTALDWLEQARTLGYCKISFEPPDDAPEGAACDDALGEFVLIYRAGQAWASWGIGCVAEGLLLWHAARGTTIGRFDTLAAALARIASAGPVL